MLGGRRGREGVEQAAEFGEDEGLGEVGPRTEGQQAPDDARGGVSGEDHHGDVSRARLRPESFEDLLSVEFGQVEKL